MLVNLYSHEFKVYTSPDRSGLDFSQTQFLDPGIRVTLWKILYYNGSMCVWFVFRNCNVSTIVLYACTFYSNRANIQMSVINTIALEYFANGVSC